MNRQRLLLKFLWAFFCFFLVSCSKEEAKDLSFVKEASFIAEIEGSFRNEDGSETVFAARTEVDRRGDEEKIRIEYLSPREMEGITVSLSRRKSTDEEQVTASLGTLSVAVSHETVKGWLFPVEGLLSSAEEPPESLRKIPSGYRFSFFGEKILTVDEKGLPLSFKTPEISLLARNIQTLE